MNFSCNGLQTAKSGISHTETHRHTKWFSDLQLFFIALEAETFKCAFSHLNAIIVFPISPLSWILPMAESSE